MSRFDALEMIGVAVCTVVGYVVMTAIIGYMLLGLDVDRLDYLPWMMWGAGCLICTVIVITVCEVLI